MNSSVGGGAKIKTYRFVLKEQTHKEQSNQTCHTAAIMAKIPIIDSESANRKEEDNAANEI